MSKSKKALYMGDQMMQSTPAAYTISKLYLYSTHRFDADTVPGKGIHSLCSGQLILLPYLDGNDYQLRLMVKVLKCTCWDGGLYVGQPVVS